jgi:hypothetical protein
MPVTIYRKKDNKVCQCDVAQLDMMTSDKDAKYSKTPVELKGDPSKDDKANITKKA